MLGLRFLEADLATLRELEALPDVLDRLELTASIALLFALGQDTAMPHEIRKEGTSDDPEVEFFRRWRDQGSADGRQAQFALGTEPFVLLESVLLGCHVRTKCENLAPCVELAESFHAALESLLSTALAVDAISREPVLRVSIRRSEFGEPPFSFRLIDEDGQPHLVLACRTFSPHQLSFAEQRAIQDRLVEVLIAVFARILVVNDLEAAVTKLFRDERALERAVSFTSSFVTVGNVLGHEPKGSVTQWIAQTDTRYPLKRTEEWDRADRSVAAATAGIHEKGQLTMAEGGEPPQDLIDGRRTALHSEIGISSVIRAQLWDEAEWGGVGSLVTVGDKLPPVLFLLFRNLKAARSIFRAWEGEFGDEDTSDRIHVGIVRGVSKSDPHIYRVVIGANMAADLQVSRAKYAVSMYRMKEMRPASHAKLDRFLASYAKVGRYLIAPAIWRDGATEPSVELDVAIEKTSLCVRNAWEVGRHDPDAMAIRAEDDPIVPPDMVDAPIVELMKIRREEQKKVK